MSNHFSFLHITNFLPARANNHITDTPNFANAPNNILAGNLNDTPLPANSPFTTTEEPFALTGHEFSAAALRAQQAADHSINTDNLPSLDNDLTIDDNQGVLSLDDVLAYY